MSSAADPQEPQEPQEPSADGAVSRRSLIRAGRTISYLDSHPGEPADSTRRAVLLVHGFPDDATMWTEHVAPLTAAGLRVLAPDTIGCGHSSIPARVRDHHVTEVVADLVAVIDQARVERVDVVGHDWGAVLSWFLCGHHPDRVRSLTAMSVGHPTSYARDGLPQKLRAWYILYFLLGGLAELGLRHGPGRLGLEGWGRRHPRIAEVRDRLAEPGRLTAALRLYRANMVFVLLRSHPRVDVPVFGVWSTGDEYLTEAQMLGSRWYLDGTWDYAQLTGGHWIPLDQPERSAEIVLSHIR